MDFLVISGLLLVQLLFGGFGVPFLLYSKKSREGVTSEEGNLCPAEEKE